MPPVASRTKIFRPRAIRESPLRRPSKGVLITVGDTTGGVPYSNLLIFSFVGETLVVSRIRIIRHLIV